MAPTDPEWPPSVQSLFWDYEADALDWPADRDLIVRRVLSDGTWDAIT